MASAVLLAPAPATTFGELNLDLLMVEKPSAAPAPGPAKRGKKKQPPKAADNREGKMSKSNHESLHNSFVPLSEGESSALASPASSTELTTFLLAKPYLKAKDEANAVVGSSLAVQQLLEEADEAKLRKSRRKSLKSSADVAPIEVEVKLSITPTAAPLFYSSDLLYASELNDDASKAKTKTKTKSIYDTPFWRKYGFVLVHLSMVLCQSCFSAVNVFGKYGLIYIHPIVLIILRNIGTLPFLMLGVGLLERNQIMKCISWYNMLKFSAMAIFTMQISQSMYVFGLQRTTATNSATLHLAIPVWTCLVCLACRMERFSVIKVLGIGCAVGGALVMVEVESFDVSGDTMTGNLLVLGMTILYSLYLVLCKPLVANLPPLNVSMWIFIGASVSSIPLVFLYWDECVGAMHVTNGQAWVSVSLAVVVGTAIPYLIITWAIKQASPLVVAIYTPMELISTTVLAFIFLGEEPGLRQFAGAMFILAGLAVTTYAQQTEKKRGPTEDIEEQTITDKRTSLDSDKSFTAGLDISETTPLIARTA